MKRILGPIAVVAALVLTPVTAHADEPGAEPAPTEATAASQVAAEPSAPATEPTTEPTSTPAESGGHMEPVIPIHRSPRSWTLEDPARSVRCVNGREIVSGKGWTGWYCATRRAPDVRAPGPRRTIAPPPPAPEPAEVEVAAQPQQQSQVSVSAGPRLHELVTTWNQAIA